MELWMSRCRNKHHVRHSFAHSCDTSHVAMQIHAKRVTIMPKDIQLARRIRGERA